MEIKFENKYVINTDAIYKGSVEIDIKEFVEENNITSKDELLCEFENYMNERFLSRELINDGDYDKWNDYFDPELTILNIEELIPYIKETSCCDLENGNYCSICGTKLK